VPELAAGISNVGSAALTVPATVPAGTYYVIARADADGAVAEVLETNNHLARAMDIGGDLVVSSLTAPAKAAAGSTISVSDTTTNQGVGGVSESTTRFYLSVNTTVGAGDTLLGGSHAVPELAAGSNSTSTTAVTIPPGVEPGTYYLLARADADNVVSEVSDSNNTKGRSIQLGGDLMVSALTVPARAAAGADIVVNDTVTNQGGDGTPESVTRFYLSANSVLDGSDMLLAGSRTVPQLAAGGTSAGPTTVTIPSSVAPGSYYVIGRADADGVVAETSESNNNLARPTTLGGDLVVSALTVPAKIGAGSDVAVTDTTANQGEGGAAASNTRFYLSVNTVVDAGDMLLAGSHAVPELAMGVSHTSTTTVSIPAAIAAGTYYLIAKADGDNAVGEASESNNSRARSTQVGGDLIVSALTVPAKAGVGTDIVASDTTMNQGGGGVPSSTLRFYLSANTVLDANDLLLSGSHVVGDLESGASYSGNTMVAIPPSVTPATYYVIAKADADNTVAEAVENNNILSRSIQIGGDLTVSALTGPSSAPSGSSIVMNDTTSNQGGGAVAASTTRFYFSTNPTFDASDTLLAQYRAVPALGAGESSAGPTTITIPSGLAPKTYYVIAVADGDGVVAERVETNNSKAKAISVTAGS
jgi:subtilase family serine protease